MADTTNDLEPCFSQWQLKEGGRNGKITGKHWLALVTDINPVVMYEDAGGRKIDERGLLRCINADRG